uniref:SAM domain-containing protein n=1 Tax=Minutocellus polymorphus TaxID=265543 RepID=A0A7S0AVU2_9STRA
MTAGGTKPINEWTVEEVGQWLVAIGLGSKVDVFATNAVSGDMLLELEEEDLKGDLTLTSLQIKKLKKSIEFNKSLEEGGAGSNEEDAAKMKELEEEMAKLKADLSAAEEKNKGLEEELQKLKVPEKKQEEVVEEKATPPPPPPQPKPNKQQGPGRPVVAGAAGGAARGAVMGAVAGAIAGDAAQGAKIGAATGATGGALRGVGARRARRRAFG